VQQLSPAGQQVTAGIAQRQGFSIDAVRHMLDAVLHGNGSMAQFSHGEFSGSGQWMHGGMTMVSDMFNNGLKGRVDSLCSELSNLICNQPGLMPAGSFQSQIQGAPMAAVAWGGERGSAGSGPSNSDNLFVPPPPDWWGSSLRYPNSTGAQNGARYAYFAQARRLAAEVDGTVTIYDTLDHQIGDFSQQQSGDGTMSCNSHFGTVLLASLPVVSVNGQRPFQAPVPAAAPGSSSAWGSGNTAGPSLANNRVSAAPADLLSILQKLADLHSAGIPTAGEFSTKKADLLSRL
jgi:hypothetical protein